MSATYLYGDCLEVMKSLPDKSVECFICDLPYGCLTVNGPKSKMYTNKETQNGCAWDVKIDLEKFWIEIKRLAKSDHTPVIHFCNTKFGYDLIHSNPSWFRYDLVWDKQRGVSFLLANKQPMKSHEMIYVFAKKMPYYKRIDVPTDKPPYKVWARKCIKSRHYGLKREIDKSRDDGLRCVLSVNHFRNALYKHDAHPTEKPTELYEWLLKRYCPDGGTVLDPTAGSFNSVKVAEQLGLNGIGIEKDRDFFLKAVERSVPPDDE